MPPPSSGPHRHYGPPLRTLLRRAEFQRLRGGTRWSGTAFLIEGKQRATADVSGTRFGFTITKKIGKAHERNRMRRRLSHALRTVALPPTLNSWDVVVIVRRPALTVPFETLVADFNAGLTRLARAAAAKPASVAMQSRTV